MLRLLACSRGYKIRRCVGNTLFRSVERLANAHVQHNIPNTTLHTQFHLHHGVVHEPTIYALSTAAGRAAIAVIRVSGPGCTKIYESLCPNTKPLKPRYAAVRSLYEPVLTKLPAEKPAPRLLDSSALVLHFPRPRSATGEDILELHVHGGPAVVKAVLGAISRCTTPSHPIRYAEPGEFTRRAFLNDRLSLPQVEALGDTLAAVTEEQRRLSVAGTVSGLAERYEAWRGMLLAARGELEALIDFSEDQHFDESPVVLAANVAVQVRALVERIATHSANAVRGELLRNGIGISLIGAPNVGKSSLLNQIVGRNAAIVSKEAGTTRDIVEVGIDLGGFFCRLGDTAGLRRALAQGVEPSAVLGNVVGEVEQEGIKRAKAKALESDVVILVLSVEKTIDGQGAQLSLDPEVLETAKQLLAQSKTLVVAVNKMDLYGADAATMVPYVKRALTEALPELNPRINGNTTDNIFYISCHDANNHNASTADNSSASSIQPLLNGLTQTFRTITTPTPPTTTSASPTHDASEFHESLGATERQRTLLDASLTHLRAFLQQVDDATATAHDITQNAGEGKAAVRDDHEHFDVVLAAESLRAAAECLAKLTGRSAEAGDVEEVLGVVFEKFCVGK